MGIKLSKILMDDDVIVISERPIKFISGGQPARSRILIATAGYKNKLLFGTESMYITGQMVEFRPEAGIWYTLVFGGAINATDGHASMTCQFYIKNNNLKACIGKYIPGNFNPLTDTSPDVIDNMLYSPIELKVLERHLKLAVDKADDELEFKRITSDNIDI